MSCSPQKMEQDWSLLSPSALLSGGGSLMPGCGNGFAHTSSLPGPRKMLGWHYHLEEALYLSGFEKKTSANSQKEVDTYKKESQSYDNLTFCARFENASMYCSASFRLAA